MKALGILMVIAGVVLGLYVGIWIMFIGGIVGLVNVVVIAVDGGGIDGLQVGLNVAKIVFTGLIGTLSAMALVIPGMAIISND